MNEQYALGKEMYQRYTNASAFLSRQYSSKEVGK